MNNIIHILPRKAFLVLSMIGLSAASCKKLIEIPANPPTQIPTSQVFSDSADIMGAMAGLYGYFRVSGGGSNLTNGTLVQSAGLSADELTAISATDASGLQFQTNSLVATNASLGGIWSPVYQSIYIANANLQGIGAATSISDSLKRQLLGETRVIRAFYYFNMVNLFGGVPLVLSTDYNVTASLPRAGADSVYGQIIADLTTARQLLQPGYPSVGRARCNLYTADALLSKVYLYRQQWAAAANLASEVINSGLYSLVADPNKVYLDGSAEAIWQLPASNSFNNTQTTEAGTLYPQYGTPKYALTTFQMNAFETGDKRKTAWTLSLTSGGKVYNLAYKYKNRVMAAPTVEDYMMMRLGEVYLMRAEALARQGKTDSALADLNQIRVRAGLTAIMTVGSSDELLNDIAHERQVELFCEMGNRWYDLNRTGAADAVLGAEKPGWASYDALYPIPLTEITNNSFLTQNPGY